MKTARRKIKFTPSKEKTEKSAAKGRVLVQDDEEPIRQIMGAMLTRAGYECRLVETSAETLRVLKTAQIDLVFCGVIEWTAEDFEGMVKTYPDVPVVVATAVHDASVPLRVLRMGAYDLLLKPFATEQLLAVVRRALEYRRLKLENRVLQTRLAKLVPGRKKGRK